MAAAGLLTGENPADILTVARILREGGVAVVPTDTVYGIACSIFQPDATQRVFAIKRRDPGSRVPVLLASAADLTKLTRYVPRSAWRLIDAFWPGPLTLVLPATSSIPHAITRGGDTVAVRVPGARSTLELLQSVGEPLVGTSANVSGQPPLTSAAEAVRLLGPEVDAILADDAAIRTGVASTVVELVDGQAVIHRAGAITSEDIRGVLRSAVRVSAP